MKYIPASMTRQIGRQLLTTQKHSPALLFGAGIIGFGATVVLAARATLKADEVLQKAQNDLHYVREMKDNPDYSAEENKRDLIYVYTRTTIELARLYGPSLIVGTLAVSALAGSHNVLTKRNAALTASYAALEKAWKEYRERVVDAIGEDREREIRLQLEPCELEDEKGKKVVKSVATRGGSIYARFFGPENQNWSPVPEVNLLFIRCQQNYLNDRLRARGHVFLNEMYDALGIERSSEGAVTGWIWQGEGDNAIDFGIWDGDTELQVYDFVRGREGIWLDPNVDGVIYDKI